MISFNLYKVPFGHFPDGTLMINNFPDNALKNDNIIVWNYESEEELIVLMYTVNHIRNMKRNAEITLFMPYIPNARMDRTKHSSEVFTMKYFANVINSLGFKEIHVLDPHSDVSVALLDNVSVTSANNYIDNTIWQIRNTDKLNTEDIVIYFPDAGAYKRYKDLEALIEYDKIYGQKVRNWETGKIEGLKIVDANGTELKDKVVWPLADKTVIMIDDIISYGGTFHYSAEAISKLNAKTIYAYASHIEPNSIWDSEKGIFGKDLQNNVVKHLFTTDSIYNKKSDSFVTVYNF